MMQRFDPTAPDALLQDLVGCYVTACAAIVRCMSRPEMLADDEDDAADALDICAEAWAKVAGALAETAGTHHAAPVQALQVAGAAVSALVLLRDERLEEARAVLQMAHPAVHGWLAHGMLFQADAPHRVLVLAAYVARLEEEGGLWPWPAEGDTAEGPGYTV